MRKHSLGGPNARWRRCWAARETPPIAGDFRLTVRTQWNGVRFPILPTSPATGGTCRIRSSGDQPMTEARTKRTAIPPHAAAASYAQSHLPGPGGQRRTPECGERPTRPTHAAGEHTVRRGMGHDAHCPPTWHGRRSGAEPSAQLHGWQVPAPLPDAAERLSRAER